MDSLSTMWKQNEDSALRYGGTQKVNIKGDQISLCAAIIIMLGVNVPHISTYYSNNVGFVQISAVITYL